MFVSSLKIYVSFAEYSLFYNALLQKRPMFWGSLLIVATSSRSACQREEQKEREQKWDDERARSREREQERERTRERERGWERKEEKQCERERIRGRKGGETRTWVRERQKWISVVPTRGGGLGSRPKNMYWERLGDGVEYHLMSPTTRR